MRGCIVALPWRATLQLWKSTARNNWFLYSLASVERSMYFFIVSFLSFYVQVVSRGSVPVFCEFGAIVSWPVDLEKML